MENKKYYVEIDCNGSVLAECATHEEALRLICQYEEEDEADGTYEPGYYGIRHGDRYERYINE